MVNEEDCKSIKKRGREEWARAVEVVFLVLSPAASGNVGVGGKKSRLALIRIVLLKQARLALPWCPRQVWVRVLEVAVQLLVRILVGLHIARVEKVSDLL